MEAATPGREARSISPGPSSGGLAGTSTPPRSSGSSSPTTRGSNSSAPRPGRTLFPRHRTASHRNPRTAVRHLPVVLIADPHQPAAVGRGVRNPPRPAVSVDLSRLWDHRELHKSSIPHPGPNTAIVTAGRDRSGPSDRDPAVRLWSDSATGPLSEGPLRSRPDLKLR